MLKFFTKTTEYIPRKKIMRSETQIYLMFFKKKFKCFSEGLHQIITQPLFVHLIRPLPK